MGRLPWVVVLVFVAGIAGGCGGDKPSGVSKPAAAGKPASAKSQEYESKDFAVPLTAAVDTTVLNAKPAVDSEHLLFWDALHTTDGKKIRFLDPVEIYRAGSRVAPPKHYLRYLRGLSKRGVKFTDASHMTIDGRSATLLTGTTRHHLNAVLGCPEAGNDLAEACFGIQPEFRLRIAVINGGTSPLLAWARTPVEEPAAAFEHTFESMLKTVRFR